MSRRTLFPASLLGLVVLASCTAAAQEVAIAPDRASGIYQAGEKAAWLLTSPRKDRFELKYRVKPGGYAPSKEGVLVFTDGQARLEWTSAEPGWFLLEVDRQGGDGKSAQTLGGLLFSPERIQPSSAPPPDFDRFWQEKIALLRSKPARPRVEPGSSGRDGVDYEKVTLDGHEGAQIYGQLAKPQSPGKKPALLIVQWAGVYKLEKAWAVDRAAEGWLAFNIQAHELPVDGTPEFFQAQASGPLANYPRIGSTSRETSTFLRMYLSCIRAADYLASRPEWDGKVMVVTGGSQGGLQSLVTAALHEKITGVVANVPAGCDQNGPSVGRAAGWPSWPWIAQSQGEVKDKVMEAAAYFDVVHFARKIKAPMLVGIGGIDTVCPPPGIYAALNLTGVRKEVIYMPLADHLRDHSAYYPRASAWMNALKEGKAP